jgi:hypothetical protein
MLADVAQPSLIVDVQLVLGGSAVQTAQPHRLPNPRLARAHKEHTQDARYVAQDEVGAAAKDYPAVH